MGHQHDHQHAHDHGHGEDFDWEGMAERLELDATLVLPIVDQVIGQLAGQVDWTHIGNVMDVGCGPGVVTAALAEHAPHAQMLALDASEPLLARVTARARSLELGDRVHILHADMEAGLPDLPPLDVIWAGMVVHHVADPVAVLTDLLAHLRPGGTLVMIEFADSPTVLPADDPVVTSGTWARADAATAAALSERLGLDPLTVDWPALLSTAGFEQITDATMTARHDAPLDAPTRAWLTQHLARTVEWVGDRVDEEDRAVLARLAATAADRDDLVAHAQRRVLTALRPA